MLFQTKKKTLSFPATELSIPCDLWPCSRVSFLISLFNVTCPSNNLGKELTSWCIPEPDALSDSTGPEADLSQSPV